MKRLICCILCFLYMTVGFGQSYSNDVTLLNKDKNAVTVRTSGIHEKKKDAAEMAVKSAFYTYFFIGIPGLNDDKPLLKPEDEINYRDYFDRFFEQGRYRNFVRAAIPEGDPEKLRAKDFKATVRLTFQEELLRRDLELNKIAIKGADRTSMEETQEQIQLPTIMVVPYKEAGRTFEQILKNDYDKRMAVAKVQEGFNRKGVMTVDFEAKLNAAKRAMQYESNSAESFDKQLLRNSGSDVYVTVDIYKDIAPTGSRVALTLKGYETASGNVLASRQSSSNRFKTSAMDQLCVYAVNDILDDFLKDIATSFAHKIVKGNTVVLNVSIAGTAVQGMETEVGPQSYPLADLLRLWVKKNAVGGKYHVQGSVAEAIIFDQIQIPNRDENGNALDVNDFAFSIWEYLRGDLNIPCRKKVDGNTIYIIIE